MASPVLAQPLSPGCNPGLTFSTTPNLVLRKEPYRRCPNAFIDDYNYNMGIVDVLALTGACPPGNSCNVTGAWTFSTASLNNPIILNGTTTGVPVYNAQSLFTSDGITHVPVKIQGTNGQTGDLQEWLDSNSVVLAKIDKSGNFSVGGTSGFTIPDGGTLTCGSSTGCNIGGSGAKIGFYAATPVVQPTGAVDLLTALTNLGLVASGTHPLNLGSGALTAGVSTLTTLSVPSAATIAGGLIVDNVFPSGLVSFSDAANIDVGATTGTKIGLGTNRKLGFWNATPIVQPNGTSDILADLQNEGLMASGTHPLNLGTGVLTAGATTVSSLTSNAAVTVTKDATAIPTGGPVQVQLIGASCNPSLSCNLTTKTIGGVVTTGRVFHIHSGGTLTQATGIRYEVTFGAAVVCDTGVLSGTLTGKVWVFDAYITTQLAGNPATVQCTGTFHVSTANAAGGAGAAVGDWGMDVNTSTANLTGTPFLKTNVITQAGDTVAENTAVFDEQN